MFRSNPRVDRAIDFFTLPRLYWNLLRWPEYQGSWLSLARDLLWWFFDYRTFPNNYGPCRLWEVPKEDWKYYYGSNYQSYQRAALTREVQPVSYAIVFHDKAVCERLCRDSKIHMPMTYGLIRPHERYRERLVEWLEDAGATSGLIIKPLLGAAGRGIVLARKHLEKVLILTRSQATALEEFQLQEDAIVQGIVSQDPRMAVFSATSLNTIRVATMLTKDGAILILGATMRCGVGNSHVDNWSAGGVAVGVDVNSGKLRKYAYDMRGNRYTEHPTTKARFDGSAIPEWSQIIELAVTVQRLFPFYRILGLDIGVADKGRPILIEVNNNTDFLFQEQTSGPLLRQEDVLRAFGQDNLLINRHQRKLYALLEDRPGTQVGADSHHA